MSHQPGNQIYPILQSGYVKELDKKIANVGRPTVFIGSSLESGKVAQKVKESFPEDKFQVDIWYDGIFGRTRSSGGTMSNMEWLKNFTDIYDFAIFIFVPEDAMRSMTRFDTEKGNVRQAYATRHNVVFEFGMFLGRIGAKRSFILFDEAATSFVDLFFTDLKENLDDRKNYIEINDEFQIELYPYKGNYQSHLAENANVLPYDEASINEAITKIQEQMIRNFGEIEIGFLPATTLAFGYYNNFVDSFITSANSFVSNGPYPTGWQTQKIPPDDLTRYRKELQAAKLIKLKIVIPSSIEGARQKNFIPDFDKSVFTEENFPGSNRSITIKRKKNNESNSGEWIIYDVPTTLNSSIEAIERLTKHKDIRELLKEKELRNFRQAMEYKIALAAKVPATNNIRELVELITYDNFKKEIQL